eukprot:365197-Chlamydomonas_euryale.AAC.7
MTASSTMRVLSASAMASSIGGKRLPLADMPHTAPAVRNAKRFPRRRAHGPNVTVTVPAAARPRG